MLIELPKPYTGRELLETLQTLAEQPTRNNTRWITNYISDPGELEYKTDKSVVSVGDRVHLSFQALRYHSGILSGWREVPLDRPAALVAGLSFSKPVIRTGSLDIDGIYRKLALGLEYYRGDGGSHFHWEFRRNLNDPFVNANRELLESLIREIQEITQVK